MAQSLQQHQEAEIEKFCHDLRQYVAAGKLIAAVPTESAAEGSERIQVLSEIFGFIDELVASALGEAEGAGLRFELNALVSQCVAITRALHGAVIIDDSSGAVQAAGDPTMVRRAVANVLDNAARAAGPDGHVTVSVTESEHTAIIEISDDGIGFGGVRTVSGHGMTVVWQALRSVGGRLEIASGPGPGTTVRLVLPRRPLGLVA
jgi:signal transduction histidine kinase